MTADTNRAMRDHLLRTDGQEDVLAATYVLSSGPERTTAIIRLVILPEAGERLLHGNAAFTGRYVARAASEARTRGEGLVLLHSHPGSHGWQGLSGPDRETESDYERVGRRFTGKPLLGMTLAGDGEWSARFWQEKTTPTWAESVRVVSDLLNVSWNDRLLPPPPVTGAQTRTVSAWGERAQASIARLRVLVVGAGSVGLDVAQRLAATGLLRVGVMDFDGVEELNLDRMIGATQLDAALGRSKVDVAVRLMNTAATAERFTPIRHESNITDPDGMRLALDYDVIISCVDRPWPRAIMNLLAYSDLIPVIDGGIALDTFTDGRMRGGIWRAHTLVPGRPCMACIGQLDLGELPLDRHGLLDDPEYIARTGQRERSRQNVASLSASVSAAVLAQFVSLTAHPGGRGVPHALRYLLAPHVLTHSSATTGAFCTYESELLAADERPDLTAHQESWRQVVAERRGRKRSLPFRILGQLETWLQQAITGRSVRRRIEIPSATAPTSGARVAAAGVGTQQTSDATPTVDA